MLNVQLEKLKDFNGIRRDNYNRIQAALEKDPRYSKFMKLMKPSEGTDPAWFGIAVILHGSFAHQLKSYLKYLHDHGVENRPVISGNFLRQPSIAKYCEGVKAENFPGSEAIHTRGFFIGVHQVHVSDEKVTRLVSVMLSYPFEPHDTVLVTGSNGMLGSALRDVVLNMEPKGELKTSQATWVFATRQDANLCDLGQVETLFKRHSPSHVLHCAGRLSSIKEMAENPIKYWMENDRMNANILDCAHRFQAWLGPVKVVSVLSSVMFPTDAALPMDSSCIYAGQMHPASEAYGLSKRALGKLSSWYKKQHGDNFVCVLPANFYGPHGDFNPNTAPLVNALIAKAELAKSTGQPLTVMGSGMPERQVMFASDLARVMMWVTHNYDNEEPLIVAGEEVSVRHVAETVCKATGLTTGLSFDTTGPDGPLKRTADTKRFDQLLPDFKWTPLSEGIRETMQAYRSQA